MKIGILKETKIPVDNRVALTPTQIKELMEKYPHISFKVQPSDIRAYHDDEYRDAGITLDDDISDCNVLLGIKEATPDSLLPNKHYIFFGHIAKKQSYNKPLFRALLKKKVTFSDYEYLVNPNGERLVAFGWYAGIVGVYYTLAAWGKRTQLYSLPKPTLNFSTEDMISNLRQHLVGKAKIAITGAGRVSKGAQYILDRIGINRIPHQEFLAIADPDRFVYCVLPKDILVKPNDKPEASSLCFKNHPEAFHSDFKRYQSETDILISCHYWENNQPKYITTDEMKSTDFRIKLIGDITCDIKGSIESTIRSSTHNHPFYDFNPLTESEQPPFSSPSNITVMAVDTCPNALPRETSKHFGEQLIAHVLKDLFENPQEPNQTLERATIVKEGKLTPQFSYLQDYVQTL